MKLEDELRALSVKLGISYKKILEVFKAFILKTYLDPVKDENGYGIAIVSIIQ